MNEMTGVREPIPTTINRGPIRDRLRAHGKISEIMVAQAGHRSIREPVVVKWQGGNAVGWWEIHNHSIKYIPMSKGDEIKVLATYSN